mgnify:CR=1 FL=1
MQERERMLQSCVLVGLRKNRCSAGGCRPTDGHAVRHAQLVCRERKYCLIHVQAASTLASFCDTLEPRSPIDKPGSVCAWAWVHHMHIPSRYAPIHRAYEHKHVISKGSQKKKMVGRARTCIDPCAPCSLCSRSINIHFCRVWRARVSRETRLHTPPSSSSLSSWPSRRGTLLDHASVHAGLWAERNQIVQLNMSGAPGSLSSARTGAFLHGAPRSFPRTAVTLLLHA